MSRWSYDTACPPPQAWEAVHGARDVLRSSGLFVDGNNWLASTDDIFVVTEEPVDKPKRVVVLRQGRQLALRRVDPSGLLKVLVHVSVAGEKLMSNVDQWHGGMHGLIQETLIGAAPVLVTSEVGDPFRLYAGPSGARYYPDTNTWESFAEYAVTLQPKTPI